ncbi:hypothetical protein CLIB1423_06S05776 [[Candida] railenensis]|uniref:BHLH domain-containing protein n=1 Tax=[Candida] railenensis TaxID=45579 RepID=A0A9P0QNC7_9ASCO|nr:hypothetical protein CLIB1423_06S05776 [[Candida] railenensis]
MEEFLKDSNSDFGNLSKTQSNQQQYNNQTTTPGTVSSENSNNIMGDLDPFQFTIDNNGTNMSNYNSNNTSNSNNNNGNNYGNYGNTGNNSNNNNNNSNNLNAYNPNLDNEFLSPTTSYSNDNNFGIFGSGAGGYDPLMEELGYTNSNPLVGPSSFGAGGTSSFVGSPLGSPQSQRLQSNFINPMTTSNLDELISPSSTIDGTSINNSNNNNSNSFLNPQYFSPPTRGSNFNSLNPIAEGNYTPSHSRHGSISIPYDNNDVNRGGNVGSIGGYLSPSNYMSPLTNVNSLNEIRSPPYNQSQGQQQANLYLNSPPEFQISNVNSNSNSNSNANANSNANINIPNSNSSTNNNSANPLIGVTKQLGTSPNTSSSKQLTKEEKLKRRREFHNAVERRRRDLIKERIKDLGILVPSSLLNPQLSAVQALQRNSQYNSREINDIISNVKAKETKPNKSTILNKSVDYVEHLEYVLKMQKKAREELEWKISQIENDFQQQGGDPDSNSNIKIEDYSNYDNFNNTNNSNNSNNTNDNNTINTNSNAIEGTNLKFEDPNNSMFNPDDFFSDIVTGGGSINSKEFFDI